VNTNQVEMESANETGLREGREAGEMGKFERTQHPEGRVGREVCWRVPGELGLGIGGGGL